MCFSLGWKILMGDDRFCKRCYLFCFQPRADSQPDESRSGSVTSADTRSEPRRTSTLVQVLAVKPIFLTSGDNLGKLQKAPSTPTTLHLQRELLDVGTLDCTHLHVNKKQKDTPQRLNAFRQSSYPFRSTYKCFDKGNIYFLVM